MKLRLGTRGSELALLQSGLVADQLRGSHDGLEVELVEISTTGDRVLDRPLRELGGKGLFVRELDQALLEGRIECAVHSVKDLPSTLEQGIVLASVPARESAVDVLLTRAARGLDDLARGATVGTTSPRRSALLKSKRPDLEIVFLRGNLGTRLDRLRNAEFDATLLAAAGLKRLGLDLGDLCCTPLDPREFCPAPGQGALGVTARSVDGEVRGLLAAVNDPYSFEAVGAERAVSRRLGASCYSPVAAWARHEDGVLKVEGTVVSPDGRLVLNEAAQGDPGRAVLLGIEVANGLLARGAADVMARAEAGD